MRSQPQRMSKTQGSFRRLDPRTEDLHDQLRKMQSVERFEAQLIAQQQILREKVKESVKQRQFQIQQLQHKLKSSPTNEPMTRSLVKPKGIVATPHDRIQEPTKPAKPKISENIYHTQTNPSPIKRNRQGLYSSHKPPSPPIVTLFSIMVPPPPPEFTANHIDKTLTDIEKIESKLLNFLRKDVQETPPASESTPIKSIDIPTEVRVDANLDLQEPYSQNEPTTNLIDSDPIGPQEATEQVKSSQTEIVQPVSNHDAINPTQIKEEPEPKQYQTRTKNRSEDFERKRQQLEKLIALHINPARLRQREKSAVPKKRQKQYTESASERSLLVNVTTAFMDVDVVKRLVEKNKWKYAYCNEGDILWSSTKNCKPIAQTVTQQMAQVYSKMRISRIPGMRHLANKKTTSYFLSKFQEYFPSIYDFFPRTYTLPEDFAEFHKAYRENTSKLFIAKPDKGTQGQGIFIVRELSQLFTNDQMDMTHLRKGHIIQEYIQNPLLIDNKKFDLRIYVLVASLDPLIVYINEEGLARFCTEDYQEANANNAGNTYMHLTNYSLNKENLKFVHQPQDFMGINNATKRTYTSAKASLQKMNVDVPKLKQQIDQVIIRFMYAMHPFLQFNLRETFQDKWRDSRCFHVLGFDVLIDRDLRPWILEVNANPSLAITQEMIASDGTKSVSVSELDLFVKSKVIEDAFVIAMHDPADQLKLVQRGHYFNSYKMLIDGSPSIENIDTFEKMLRIFGYLSGHKFGTLNGSKFSRLASVPKLVNDECMKSDYDLIFKKLTMRNHVSEMNFNLFIDAIEALVNKLLQRRSKNYTKQKAVIWVVDRAIEYFAT